VISAWEQSGNGFGMPRQENDPDFGKVTEDSFVEGDNRAAFLKQYYDKMYLLHFWAQSDNLGILSNVMSVLSKAVAGDCDGNLFTETAAVQHRRKRVLEKKKHEKQAKRFRAQVGSSLKALASSSEAMALAGIRENIQKLQGSIDAVEVKWFTEEDTPLKMIYAKQKNKKVKELKTLKREAKLLHDKLFKAGKTMDDGDHDEDEEEDDENTSSNEDETSGE